MAEELWSTDIDLDVVLDEQTMRLSDVMNLKPGSKIVLNASVGGTVQLRCGTVTLFEGQVGRRKNRLAVRIEREVARPALGER